MCANAHVGHGRVCAGTAGIVCSNAIATYQHCKSIDHVEIARSQIRLAGFPSAGGSTSQHRSRSRPTKLWAEDSPLRRHMTLAHWHTEVFHWHTCATEVCQTKSSRSGLKVTAHRVSARSEEVAKSWHTGTPKSHQPCLTADHVSAEVSVRACGARSVCGSSSFFL